MNDSLKVNRQKIIEFENSNEFLLKENENLKIEKKKINKNLISSNEHNKHLCKELMEEKVKNIEELKNLTDLLNDKKLEINKLQNELEILRRTHEIANLKVMKFEEFDFVNELKKKNSELEEFREEYQETPKKISEKGDILNKTEYLIDQSEIQDKNQRIQDLEIMLQGYQKNENFGKLYMPLFVIFLILKVHFHK